MHKNLLIFVALLIALASPSKAQEEEILNVWIDFLGMIAVPDGLGIISDDKWVPIRLSTSARSGAKRYIGTSPLILYKQEINEEGALTTTPVGAVQLDASSTNYLVFVTPKGTETDRYTLYAFPDSEADFPPGSFRFFNLTNDRLGLLLGDARVEIPSFQFQTVKPSGPSEQNVPFRIVRWDGNSWVRTLSSEWYYRDQFRTIAFISEGNDYRRSLMIRPIVDYKRPAPPPENSEETN